MPSNRRNFIRQLSGSAMLLTAGSLKSLAAQEGHEQRLLQATKRVTANDKIRVATIGMGIMGFNDTRSALTVSGVELAACCDLYDGRLVRAKELFGKDLFTTKRYKDILDRKDIDAIIVATSDNWHARICKEAMLKGKAVYSEKPMVQNLAEGLDEIKVQQQTKAVFQVGSQVISSIAFAKAKELYESGEIGKINSVEASFDRQSALGAWQYTIPPDASPQTVDWQTFEAPGKEKHAYNSNRFFRWRNYREYGTGVAGDLFVHLLTGIHFITSSKGPEKIYAIGGTTYWKDGRDVPDVMNAVLQYPETPEHPVFQVSLRVNFVSGNGETSSTTISGTEGVITFKDDGFVIRRNKMPKAPGYGGWDSFETYPEATQKQIVIDYNKRWTEDDKKAPKLSDIVYNTPEGYNEHHDHMYNFFNSIRTGKPVVENAEFGFRAAAPCLSCNDSYFQNKVIYWDPVNMKLV